MKEQADGYKKLMIGVLAQQILCYIKAIRVGGLNFPEKLKQALAKVGATRVKDLEPKLRRHIEAMTSGELAKYYIFADSEESEEYVFGFKFICSYIGIDPERFRKKIREKREDFWNDI